MYQENRVRNPQVLYPKLSYDIVGVLIKVHKELGPGLPEKYYQKGVAEALSQAGIDFQEQVPIKLSYTCKNIGTVYADFVICKLIVVEIKTDRFFTRKNIEQTYGYLKSLNLRLGLLANFTRHGLEYKRILNT